MIFLSWSESRKKHLQLYNSIDLALDTFPYNGTTTTFEAMWMNVPVLCLEGEHHSGRVGYSILKNLNLDIPKKLTYGVMINAAEWLACDDPSLMIKKFFRPSKDSKISLVRIAINFNRALA